MRTADRAPVHTDLTGRVAVITGANSGLGLHTAEALAAAGASVVLACRDPQRGEAARATVAHAATAAEPTLVALDLADLDQVADAAAEIAGAHDRLDVLVNNAGVMAPPRKATTAQGFELQFGVNHLGHFALTGRLLPSLLAAEAPRVVTVSSGAHRAGVMHWDDLNADHRYFSWTRYGQSKLANLLFTAQLAEQARQHGTALIATAAHPGYAATNLTRNGPADRGRRRVMSTLTQLSDRLFAQSSELGALPQIHAATAPDVASNDYFGPDGLFEQRGRGVTRVSRTLRARDQTDARRLWEVSESLTGVVYDWDATAP